MESNGDRDRRAGSAWSRVQRLGEDENGNDEPSCLAICRMNDGGIGDNSQRRRLELMQYAEGEMSDFFEVNQSSRMQASCFQRMGGQVEGIRNPSEKKLKKDYPGNHFEEKKLKSHIQQERPRHRINLETRDSESAPIPVEYRLSEEGARYFFRAPKFRWIPKDFGTKFPFPVMKKKGSITPYIKLRDELRDSSSASMAASDCIRESNLSSLDIVSQDQLSSSRASNYDDSTADFAKESIDSSGQEGASSTISTHVIPVAKAIYDEPIYAAFEYDPSSKPSLFKNRRFQAYSAFALLIICSAAVIAVIYITKRTKESFANPEKSYGTLIPTLPPTTERDVYGIKEEIESHVLMRNVTFENMTDNDPRYLALEWILHKDSMQVGLFDSNLSQRYIMALIAFSLDSMAWYSCGGGMSTNQFNCTLKNNNTGLTEEYSFWLSGSDECDWYGVTCVDGIVRWIELKQNSLIGELPPEIGSLHFLQILSLGGNCLFGVSIHLCPFPNCVSGAHSFDFPYLRLYHLR